MIKRRPQLVDHRFLDNLVITKQTGGNMVNGGYINERIYSFFAKYYVLIIIVVGILLFLYWRYRSKIEEEKALAKLLLASQLAKKKQPQHPLINNQIMNPHIKHMNPQTQMMNNPQMQTINVNQQNNPYQMQQQGGCTSCAMQKDPYNFNEDTNELMFRNTKGLNESKNDYYGMAITEDNSQSMQNGFTPSNGVGDFYFPLQ